MIEKSRARLIADEIVAECHSNNPLNLRLVLMAVIRATGEFLAHIEGTLPDARHLYVTALKANLRAARDLRRAAGRNE
jgi:hypothetical protein